MTTVSPLNASGLFQQAIQAFQAAVKTGIKFQEESTQQLIGMLGKFASPLDCQAILQTFTSETSQAVQRNIDESIRLMNHNAQAALRIWQQALESYAANGQASAAPDSNHELLESTLGALRTNAQVILQANGRVLELWGQLATDMANRVEETIKQPAA